MSLAFVGSTALVVQPDTGSASRLATSVDDNKRTSLPPVPRFWLRPAIVWHDPGLAASPPVRYMLKVEGRSLLSIFCPLRTDEFRHRTGWPQDKGKLRGGFRVS